MSQGYAIELYLDPSLENQVLKAWNILAQRQISTQLIEIESRPHITLFSTPSFIDPSKIEPLIKSFAAKQDPIKLNFSSIGSFPDEGNTLFLSPTPALSSLQFQTQLYDLLKKEGFEIGDEFWVDSWVPICSVAQDVPKSRMTEAKKFRVDLWVPICSVAQDEFQVDLWVPIRGMDIGF